MLKEIISKRNIPDFFVSSLSSVSLWEEKRKALLCQIIDTEYGALPYEIAPKIETEDYYVDFAGKAKWTRVFFTFEKDGKSHTVECELILPVDKEKTDTFVYLDFPKETPSKYLPAEEIIDSGFGVFKVCYTDITSDDGDFENGLCSLFVGGGLSYGKISVWSYMAKCMASYLLSRDDIGALSVIGHSRMGKTALLTSATDSRFLLTCVNDSGCCGASISRGKTDGQEKIEDIVRVFPHWFKDSFSKYVNNEGALPFDQHMLVSCVAPRCLVIGCAELDYWADNEGAFISAYLSSPVWELYGKKGVLASDISGRGEFLDKSLCYYTRRGTHFLSRDDWQKYISKFKEITNGN